MITAANPAPFPHASRSELVQRIRSTLGCRSYPIVALLEAPGSGLHAFLAHELCRPATWDGANCLMVSGESFLADTHLRVLRGELSDFGDSAFFDAEDVVRARSILDAVGAGAGRDENGWVLAITNMQALSEEVHFAVVSLLALAAADPACNLKTVLGYTVLQPARAALAPRMEALVDLAGVMRLPPHDAAFLGARALLFEDRSGRPVDRNELGWAYRELGESSEALDALLLHMLESDSEDVAEALNEFLVSDPSGRHPARWNAMSALERHLLRHVVQHAPIDIFGRQFAMSVARDLGSEIGPQDVQNMMRKLTRTAVIAEVGGQGHFALLDPTFSLYIRQQCE